MPQDHQDAFEWSRNKHAELHGHELSIWPHDIAWMIKDNSHIYQLLRAVPSLYELVEHCV